MAAYYIYGEKSDHVLIKVFGLALACFMDPIWRILHLYSAELFPTVVRNMARGICNVAAKIGSLISPAVVFLRSIYFYSSNIIYAVSLTLELIIVIIYLTETKGKTMPDDILEEIEKKHGSKKDDVENAQKLGLTEDEFKKMKEIGSNALNAGKETEKA